MEVCFSEAHAGVLVMRNVVNPSHHSELEKHKTELEEKLRSQFSGQDRAGVSAHPVLQTYNSYYRRFKKSYHVQLQVESIVWKGKSIPSVSALVEAMFMTEMKNMLLTAGHDLDILQLPLILDVSNGTESYQLMRGDDMMISDKAGIISNIIYEPDQRTQITESTRNVVFTVYTPAGINEQAVESHLHDIQEYVRIVAPRSRAESLTVYG